MKFSRWTTIALVSAAIIILGNLAMLTREFASDRLNAADVEPWLPSLLYLSGTGLLFAALIAMAAEIVARADARVPEVDNSAIKATSIEETRKLMDSIAAAAKALAGMFGFIPAWAFIGVAAVGLIAMGSLYDGYTLFGNGFDAPVTGVAATATSVSIEIQMTVGAAEAQATISSLATPVAP